MADKNKQRQERAAKAEKMRQERERAERRQRNLITSGIVAVVVVLVAVAGFAIYKASQGPPLVNPTNATDDYGIVVTPEDFGAETTDDTVEMIVYEDFGCPGCQAFFMMNADFLIDALSNGEISVEYRPVNFLDRNSPNNHSTRAGAAAICVFETDGGATFKDYQGFLYSIQPSGGMAGPDDETLVQQALAFGASDAVEDCINEERFHAWVRESGREFTRSPYSGTPTVLIADEQVNGEGGSIPGPEDLSAAIEAARG